MKQSSFVSGVLSIVLFAIALTSPQSHAQTTDDRGLKAQSPAKPVSELPAKAKRWALVIGVDQYRDKQIGQLGGADNDARTLADALVRYAGFPADQVILLATDQPEERQPTRVNILRRLSNLASVVPKDGLLLVSFSGHGIERNGQAYLLPSDAQISEDISFLEDTAISVSRMHDRISSTGVQQVLVLLDACRNDPASGRADAPNLLTEAYTRGFNFDVRNREVVAFATIYATAVGQRAYEYGEKKQGYFTWAIVEGLKGGAANKNGEVTLSGLVKYVQENVPKQVGIDLGIGRGQQPFAVIEGYKADELVLAMTKQTVAVSTIVESTRGSVVSVAAAWRLTSSAGKTVYHKYLPNTRADGKPLLPGGGHSIACYVRLDDGTIEPYLTFDAGENNVGIGGVTRATGFLVASSGFIITTLHVALAWKIPYVFPNNADIGYLFDSKKEKVIAIAQAPNKWTPAATKQPIGKLDGVNDQLDVAFAGGIVPPARRVAKAQLVTASKEYDLALLKIEEPDATQHVVINKRFDNIELNEVVGILGYPSVTPPIYGFNKAGNSLADFPTLGEVDPVVAIGTIGGLIRNQESFDKETLSVMNNAYLININFSAFGLEGAPVFDTSGMIIGVFNVDRHSDVPLPVAIPINYAIDMFRPTGN
jgi:uncharacterized caspase-like protein